MREIVIDDVLHEITDEAFDTLVDSGAIFETEDGYILNETHDFTAAEVRLLMNA